MKAVEYYATRQQTYGHTVVNETYGIARRISDSTYIFTPEGTKERIVIKNKKLDDSCLILGGQVKMVTYQSSTDMIASICGY